MTKADKNLLDYMVVCISEFANRYGMHMRDRVSYRRLWNSYGTGDEKILYVGYF